MQPDRATRRLVLAAIALLALAAPSAAQVEDLDMDRTVTVSATGEVSVQPDMAIITSGVVTEADAAREALTRNSETMAKLIAGLKGLGIDAKDIQTSGFSVEPRYTRPVEGQAGTIDGYQVSNQVTVRVRDLARLGEILDNVVTLGANRSQGLTFVVSNAEQLKDTARRQAIANALRRAKLYAEEAGAEVGEVVSIAEDVTSPGPRPMPYAARAAMDAAVPIESGSETLEARVTVTWRLK